MQTWPEDTAKTVLDTIDSTMAEARRVSASNVGAHWILAKSQTAGTGRRGRVWDTGLGNFSASLLYHPTAELKDLALRSYVAALALRDSLVALTGREDIFSLKWPNDVLLNGGKLAGILLETVPTGRGQFGLIVGIGVNLKSPPPTTALETGAVAPKTLLGETGVKIAPEVFLDTLAPSFDYWERQLATYGFLPLRQAWLANAARLGETINARTGTQTLTGRFETVDDQGALVLQAADGTHHIAAADIYFD